MEEIKQGGEKPFDLSELTGFQFGPAWARPGASSEPSLPKMHPIDRHDRKNSPRRPSGDKHFRPRRENESGARPRSLDGHREDRPARELPQPAEGFRVELRPSNGILEIFSKEIQKRKRAMSLLDLSRIVIAGKDRYDLVFMKLENGPSLIHSKREDAACWLTEAEAVSYLWSAPWFSELYASKEIETEKPKGSFTAIATCQLGGEIIGPVNWHGYQAALMNLYRTKYSQMKLEAFKNRITLDREEGTVQAWLEAAGRKTIWTPVREGAGELVLEDAKAVEADFIANHYHDIYEIVDKVFINGAASRKTLSPGLYAHMSILSDKTRRSPQMLIPNLCHGLARHHMPIYKWQGNHYTGPSRVRSIPAGTVLADRMMEIVNWSKEHSGEQVEAMFAALSGVPAGEGEEERKASSEAYAPYAADMLWLLEQGFLVVTNDNAIWYPKGSAAPPVKPVAPRRHRRKAQKPSEASASSAKESRTKEEPTPGETEPPVEEETAAAELSEAVPADPLPPTEEPALEEAAPSPSASPEEAPAPSEDASSPSADLQEPASPAPESN